MAKRATPQPHITTAAADVAAAAAGVQHAVVPIAALEPHPRNYRRHPEAQIQRLAASIARFGQVRSIVVQEGAPGRYLIVGGHGFVEAAKASGLEQLHADVIPATWSAAQVEGYLVADNEHTRLADDDLTALAALMEEQAAAGYHLESLGASRDDLDDLLKELADDLLKGKQRDTDDPDGGGDDFDATPDADDVPTRCQPGDLWQLGAHRLLCGDSTKREDVARLMAGATAQMVWTDPPYGINHSGGSKDPRSATYRSGGTLTNDNLSEDATQQLITEALANAADHAMPGATAYIASPPGTLLPYFIRAMDASGFEFRHSLVWVKDSFVFGRCDYHYRHETILYGWLQNGAHYFVDDRTQDSVIEIPRPKRSEEHPTMKPIALVAGMVANSSREGDVVYEPFGGSGTTLIAAERLSRRCYAIEISPRYCDVILRRWEAETGREAVKLAQHDDEGSA